jgi:hypothetical protein
MGNYNRPVSARMSTMRRMSPNPPLGKYPHPLLYPQVGSAPMSSNTRMMIRMVDTGFPLFSNAESRSRHSPDQRAPTSPPEA